MRCQQTKLKQIGLPTRQGTFGVTEDEPSLSRSHSTFNTREWCRISRGIVQDSWGSTPYVARSIRFYKCTDLWTETTGRQDTIKKGETVAVRQYQRKSAHLFL